MAILPQSYNYVEAIYLRFGKTVVQRVTVVKFGVFGVDDIEASTVLAILKSR